MAVTFKSHDTGLNFLIGGQASLVSADAGNAGTMPTYDIVRNEITLGDGTRLGARYDIIIVGVATNGTQDVTNTKGEAQNAIQAFGNNLLSVFSPPGVEKFGNGTLEIAPYGGYESIISFNDARLVSISLAEQDEETAGTQYLNYTFNFEAYDNTSTGGPSKTWLLKSASETWDLSETGEYSYDNMDITSEDNKYKTYTLTHSLSAEGIRKYTNTTIDQEDGHAWKQAANWVRDRLTATENLTAISEDMMANTDELETSFHPKLMNAPGDTSLIDLVTDGYNIRDKTRTLESDIATGSYSVTDTYTLVKGTVKATTTVETSIENSVDSEEPIQVKVNGSVIGMSDVDVDDQTANTKYINAKTEYKKLLNGANIVSTKIGVVATDAFSRFDPVGKKYGPLFDVAALSFTESHDKVNGTIDWSITFVDENTNLIDGAYSQKVSVSYTNDERASVKPSPVPVIAYGPYMYTPLTTDEQTATFNVEAKMLKTARNGKPDGQGAIIPTPDERLAGRWLVHRPRITSRTESWNPITGVYTLQLVYTYA